MESRETKEFSEKSDENYIPDNSIFMKEELIITDVANQLDGEQTRSDVAETALENIKTDETQTQLNLSNDKNTNQEVNANGPEPMEGDDDDIVIISEEKTTKSKQPNQFTQGQPLKKNVIVPEIAQRMLRIKTELNKNKRVPQSIVFIKKCRLCQKIQDEKKSQSMIKCQDCESRCFLFQCLLCFKRYTTFSEMYAHIEKKHKDKIFTEPVKKRTENKQKLPPSKGIKVKSNKCLQTNEKFKFNSNGYIPVVNQPSTADKNNLIYSVLKEDIPLKQAELENRESKIFYCTQCNYSTSVSRYYRDHVRRRHTIIDPKNYKTCTICNKKFRMLKDLKSHKMHCGQEPKYKCKFCDYKTKISGTLKVHMQSHVVKATVGELEPFADANNTSSQSNESDIQQKDSHPKSEASTSKTTVQEIIKNQIKGTIQAVCKSCNKCTKANESKYKCAKCNNFLIYRCKNCNMTSDNYVNVHEHVVNVHFAHREKPCPKCNKMVIDIRAHLKYCGIEPNFSCKHCSFKTKHEYSYIAHCRIKHQADHKNFVKCNKCNKFFAVLRYLKRHQKYYCDTKKSFGCAHCSLRTRSKGNLIRHIKLLHVETMSDVKFTCKKCNIDYRSIFMYDKHVKLCTP